MAEVAASGGREPAAPPVGADFEALKSAAAGCRACELWEHATQTVFGRGPTDARMVLVGEQPGDVEDVQGAPFVGPAGRLLVGALEDAGIDKTSVYVTNAVKHFRFEQRGSRRIHQSPDPRQVAACHPWLSAELRLVKPELVVLLGATAAKSILGPSFRVTRQRGEVLDGPAGTGARLLATIHPSAVLRTPPESREEARAGLVADLVVAREALT